MSRQPSGSDWLERSLRGQLKAVRADEPLREGVLQRIEGLTPAEWQQRTDVRIIVRAATLVLLSWIAMALWVLDQRDGKAPPPGAPLLVEATSVSLEEGSGVSPQLSEADRVACWIAGGAE